MEREPDLHEHLREVAQHARAHGDRARRALRGARRGRACRRAARHRQDRGARQRAAQARPAGRRRVADHARAPRRRRAHPGDGARAAQPSACSSATATSAGTARGYPDGLRGDGDPARRAHHRRLRRLRRHDLTSGPTPRPRRAEAALAELRRCAGTQFDPAVVNAFCARAPRWLPTRGPLARVAAATKPPPSPLGHRVELERRNVVGAASHVCTMRASAIASRASCGAPRATPARRSARERALVHVARPRRARPSRRRRRRRARRRRSARSRGCGGEHEPRAGVRRRQGAAERADERGDPLAPATQPGRALEALAGRRGAHLRIDVRQQRRAAVAAAGEQRERLVELAAVEVRVEVVQARRHAAPHLPVRRRPRTQAQLAPAVTQAEQRVELLLELDRRGAAAQRPDVTARPAAGSRATSSTG